MSEQREAPNRLSNAESTAAKAFAASFGLTSFSFPREGFISLIVLALVWEALSWVMPPYAVPGWGRIFKSLIDLRFDYVLITLERVCVALVISFVLGLAIAVAMYASSTFERYAKPVIRLFMAIPVVCWILFSVLWFKGVEFRIAYVLIVTCAPIFVIDCLDGMKGVQKDLRDMLRSFRPTRLQYFSKLILPGTLPIIFTSWKINISLAIRVVTIAELVGAVSGIGYGLTVAQELFSVADVFAWTVVLIVIMFAAEAILIRIEEHFLRWRT
jgi:ABC-type nitrate/sulfonate/bicarbonate transport system permease component